ncbi:hypothetical protein SAMN04488136_15812 [Vibrio xiamenensis]|uniref:Uncharacterized protein n=1 Tax=Vibrio xiamenensis TaxID=861298 RepID=A0A1G8HPL5_9VIBR|nr:hypothetical protein SAMN04488136_15812 [Vibrio xiamenensis]
MQADSNQLVAYVMKHNRMSQTQAMSWLDKWVPTWRTEPVPEAIGTIYYDGESDGYDE